MATQDNLNKRQFVDLYHHTSEAAAKSIKAEGFNTSDVWLSDRHRQQAAGYGYSSVHVRVPRETAEDNLQDRWPSGENYYAIPSEDIKKRQIKEAEGPVSGPPRRRFQPRAGLEGEPDYKDGEG